MYVGDCLMLIEVRRHAHCGWHYSLCRIKAVIWLTPATVASLLWWTVSWNYEMSQNLSPLSCFCQGVLSQQVEMTVGQPACSLFWGWLLASLCVSSSFAKFPLYSRSWRQVPKMKSSDGNLLHCFKDSPLQVKTSQILIWGTVGSVLWMDWFPHR